MSATRPGLPSFPPSGGACAGARQPLGSTSPESDLAAPAPSGPPAQRGGWGSVTKGLRVLLPPPECLGETEEVFRFMGSGSENWLR